MLLKKRCLNKEDGKNFRLVSNLIFILKLLEHSEWGAHRLPGVKQNALLEMYSNLNMALVEGHVTLLGLLDLRVACDIIVLLAKLVHPITSVSLSLPPLTSKLKFSDRSFRNASPRL